VSTEERRRDLTLNGVFASLNRAGSLRIALVYAGLATLWILGSTHLFSFTVQDSETLSRIELLKGLMFVFVTSGLLYLLLRLGQSVDAFGNDIHGFDSPLRRGGIISQFALLVLAVPLIGYSLMHLRTPQAEAEAMNSLAIVAQSKATQIERWMSEREADIRVLTQPGSAFADNVHFLLERKDASNGRRNDVEMRLDTVRDHYGYESVMVMDPNFHVLAVSGGYDGIAPEVREAAAVVLAGGDVARTELYRIEDDRIFIDWLAPVRSPMAPHNIIALVLLRMSPEHFLYPLIRIWPGVSETAETMLVRREGDSVLYLSELKHAYGTALTLRLPMEQEALPAAMALMNGAPGEMRGNDYLGHDVLAAYYPVAGTEWRIVSKMDRDEVLAPLWRMTVLVTGVAFVFVIVISLTLLMLWRQQNRLQSLLVLTHKTRSERLLQHFFDMPFVGMAVIAPDKRLIRFNDQLCTITGYSRAELEGRSCTDFAIPEEIEAYEQELGRILRGEISGYVMERRFVRKDGRLITTLVDTRCVRKPDGSVDHLFATVQDITRQKEDEAKIQRLTHLYAALSECNKAIVRCETEQELFRRICEATVTFGGMKMAWIGMIDDKTGMVRPVASYGDHFGYVRDIRISAEPDSPYGQGPTGRAIRSREPYWCQNFAEAEETAVWHERSRGLWKSSAALPILRGGNVAGTLNLYAGEPQAFDDAVKRLLMEMALDISFALDNFDREVRRQQVERSLADSEAKFHLLFDQSPDGLLLLAGDEVIECNPAAFSLLTSRPENLLHQPFWSFAPPYQQDGVSSRERVDEMLAAAWRDGHCRFEWTGRRFNGEDFPAEVSMVTVTLAGRPLIYVTLRDFTEQKQAEARILQLAQYDMLTGLPNRTLLTDRVNQAINSAQRNGQTLTLMFFDLDRFKNVNDSLGHSIGDELLVQVGQRLQQLVREQDTVSRLGGDEFVLLLLDTGAEGASRVAEKVMHAVSAPYRIQHHEINITLSIGIALFPTDGQDFENLLQSADIAMYRAKQSGRNNYQFFTLKMQQDSIRALQLTNALHSAIDQGQLSLCYQPQITIADGEIVGVEALLRWRHPQFGEVPSVEFIPIAEDNGDIYRIGIWVLEQAITQFRVWRKAGLCLRRMAVNMSAVQFRQPQLPEQLAEILHRIGVEPQSLELELTESVSMDEPLVVIEMMDRLAALGVQISIDDFGTGYSSLSYLKRFRVSRLKIDQTFVRDIMTDADDRAIVRAIINLAQSLGLQTIAEGVETAEQLDFLREAGCQDVQGYFFSRPLSAEAFADFCRDYRARFQG
jgi:diguanylate cyclase (GGDEF)-like protein/PAS domain S-box-containing protein